MSWYLANESGIIDQFASGSGLADLRSASQDYEALADFFDVGATKDIAACVAGLKHLASESKDADLKATALGLAKLMEGETLVGITQGFGNAAEPRLAKPITRPARKASKKATPKKGQAWFERKVAALKKEAEKLPAARQKALKGMLKKGK
jgi:hypothetical protein